jgi:hypothetical protein
MVLLAIIFHTVAGFQGHPEAAPVSSQVSSLRAWFNDFQSLSFICCR